MDNIILERSKINKCPICNEELKTEEEVDLVNYNGQPVIVHKKHVKYGG